MHLGKRVIAEFLGTFWLTFGGCGAAVISAAYPQLGIGFLGVALAFGLTVVTMAYAVNPAITIGLWAARRIPFSDVIPYIVFQVAGAIARRQCLKL
jgi:aquaporin Z